MEYNDYPYAKFDIHMDPITYSSEEYGRYLKCDNWTKSETDKLMEVARKFELRWPVIHDRWIDYSNSQNCQSPSHRKVEELQHRYYKVASILSQNRFALEAAAEVQELSSTTQESVLDENKEGRESLLMEAAAARVMAASKPQNQPIVQNLGTGSTNKSFDVAHERERRSRLDDLWNRSKEEEAEEMELRKELRLIEAQLRKLKKTGGHVLASSKPNQVTGGSKLSSAASSRNPSRSVSPVPGANIAEAPTELLDKCFASTAPVAMPKTPYLQSGRLLPPATGGPLGLNKTLLSRMDAVLVELKVPARPIPTKRVCDLYDTVRKDILKLLTLQKVLLQKEGNLQAKRLKLAKISGSGRILDEEALLGISTPTSATSSATSASAARGKGSRSTKSKSTSAASGKAKTTSTAGASKPKVDDTGKSDSKDASSGRKSKTTTKRKRKSESKSPPPSSTTGATAATTDTKSVATTQSAAAKPATGDVSTATGVDPKQGSGGGSKKRVRKT